MTALAQPESNRCFVCGPDNPQGLRLAFSLDGDCCRARYTPAPQHCGWDRQLHGGILFSVLDDAMANWLFLNGIRAQTARAELRFRQAVPIGTPLELSGRLLRRKGRVAMMASEARRVADGVVVAEASASFVVTPPD